MRSTRALQRSGSDIALSQGFNDSRREDFNKLPSSVMSVGNSVMSRSFKMMPPKSEYYYLSNSKNVNHLKSLEEDNEEDTSDEDHQPIIYPENRFLPKTFKI